METPTAIYKLTYHACGCPSRISLTNPTSLSNSTYLNFIPALSNSHKYFVSQPFADCTISIEYSRYVCEDCSGPVSQSFRLWCAKNDLERRILKLQYEPRYGNSPSQRVGWVLRERSRRVVDRYGSSLISRVVECGPRRQPGPLGVLGKKMLLEPGKEDDEFMIEGMAREFWGGMDVSKDEKCAVSRFYR